MQAKRLLHRCACYDVSDGSRRPFAKSHRSTAVRSLVLPPVLRWTQGSGQEAQGVPPGHSSVNTSSCVQVTLQFAFCVQSVIKNSLATMPGYGVGSDGDVEMTTPQPIFEFIRGPRLNTWSQAALIQFKRERDQYEKKIEERCAVTNENKANVLVSIKALVETRVLDHLLILSLPVKKLITFYTDRDRINHDKPLANFAAPV
ncbi:unnamed protein product [Phytophthora lilii]|uniref:Unnamed protein product n=1 Tax=Phytophthora lilii TaxID=2077276 RepID=A0A9W7D7N7_9STRA|nr:unnamed protein product [Phytophthora lilii]